MRQAKPWRNKRCSRYRKTRSDPAGDRCLPSKADHRLESSVAWRPGNRRDEAYTESAWAVRLSPERPWCGGRRRLPTGRLHPTGRMVWSVAPPGSKSRARARGLPRNLGGPALLREERWKPDGRERSGATITRVRVMDGAKQRTQRSTARRGNETCRDERQEVRASRSTTETGEPELAGTRRREGGAGTRNRWRARWKADQGHKPSQRNNSG